MSALSLRAIDIMREPAVVAFPETKVRELIYKMREANQRIAPVINTSGYLVGVVTLRKILESGVGGQSRVKKVMETPYYVPANADFTTIISRFLMWKAKAIPVVAPNSRILKGIISREDVLKSLLNLGILPKGKVHEFMTSPPITIVENESIARARWLMIKNGISRLPVIEEDTEKLVGIISMIDIAERLYRIRLSRRKGFEQFEEEFLAAPVRDFMSSPAIDIGEDASLEQAVKMMLEYRISGLPVTHYDKVVGVISGIDAIKAYAKQLEIKMPIEAKIPEDVSDFSKQAIERIVTNFIAKISKIVNVIDFKTSIKSESKVKKKEGRVRYRVKVMLTSDAGSFTAKATSWDPATATREALIALEKRIRRALSKAIDRSRLPKIE